MKERHFGWVGLGFICVNLCNLWMKMVFVFLRGFVPSREKLVFWFFDFLSHAKARRREGGVLKSGLLSTDDTDGHR